VPELPEVETMKRGLEKKVRGRTFLDVWTDTPKLIHYPASFAEFRLAIKGRKIDEICRRGKVLLFYLSPPAILLVHPKMTGHFLYSCGKEQVEKRKSALAEEYIHFLFWLDNGSLLAWSDLRKFSRLELWPVEKSSTIPLLQKIGPDPLTADFSLEKFQLLLSKSRRPIKLTLLDQSLVSGIGNIYASEILGAARIHPERKAFTLFPEERERIYQAMREILQEAVEQQGTSIADFRDIENEKGHYTSQLKVYRREGKPCLRCHSLIERIKLGGRSTYYCPHCQPKP